MSDKTESAEPRFVLKEILPSGPCPPLPSAKVRAINNLAEAIRELARALSPSSDQR